MNEEIATVSEDGSVLALTAGSTIIKATTEDGKKTAECQITVTKKGEKDLIILDDIKEIADRYNSLDPEKLDKEFRESTEYDDTHIKPEYLDSEGKPNEKYNELYGAYIKKRKEDAIERLSILNQLVDNQKSFIILASSYNCEYRAFSIILTTEAILKANNISYLMTPNPQTFNDFDDSKLAIEGVFNPSVAIVKKGKVYAYTDENKDFFNNEEDVKKWLSKYINIK